MMRMRMTRRVFCGILLAVLATQFGIVVAPVKAQGAAGSEGTGMAITSNFCDWRINGFTGGAMDKGGLVTYTSGSHTYRAKLVAGNIYDCGYTDRGEETLPDGRIAYHRTYRFGGEIVAYMTCTSNDIFGSTSYSTMTNTQYDYKKRCNVWIPPESGFASGSLSYRYLSMPSDWAQRAEDHSMRGSIEVGVYLNPTLLDGAFKTTFDKPTGTYTRNDTWAGIIKASAGYGQYDKSEDGLLDSGGVQIKGYTSSGGVEKSEGAEPTTVEKPAPSSGKDDIDKAVKAVGGAKAWGVGITPAQTIVKGKITDRLLTGQALQLNSNTSVQLADKFEWGLIGSHTRDSATFFMPIQLRPRVSIYQATYSWTYYKIQTDQCLLYYGTNAIATDKTDTRPVYALIENPYIVQTVVVDVDVVATYNFKPRQTSADNSSFDYRPPTTSSTFNYDQEGDVWDVSTTSAVTGLRSTISGGGLLAWLSDLANLLGLVLVVAAIVIGLVIFNRVYNSPERKLRREYEKREKLAAIRAQYGGAAPQGYQYQAPVAQTYQAPAAQTYQAPAAPMPPPAAPLLAPVAAPLPAAPPPLIVVLPTGGRMTLTQAQQQSALNDWRTQRDAIRANNREGDYRAILTAMGYNPDAI